MECFNLVLLVIIFVGYEVELVRGCWGTYYGDQGPTTKKIRTTSPEPLLANFDEAWGGFRPPDKVIEKWKNFIKDYREMREKQEDPFRDKTPEERARLLKELMKERGPETGWPDAWHGYGPGHGGNSPPPWSYQPINRGLPEYCLAKPSAGECVNGQYGTPSTRFAFNPFREECQEFWYSGCGGTHNNFDTATRCMDACTKTPKSGCDINTNIYIDE